ncbi:MAG: F0F1 ATP synthase subunit B [Planctomycetales bacterium]
MHFNAWTFLFQIVNFVVLAYILHRLLYAPIREAIDQRRKKIADQLNEAEVTHREAEALKKTLDDQLADMQKQREDVIRQAHTQAEEQRKSILAEATEEARRYRLDFEKGLDRDRSEMLTSLQQQVRGQAIELTRRLLQGSADRTLHEQLVHRLFETLNQVPLSEQTEIRQHWRSTDEVVLESASEIGPSLAAEISKVIVNVTGVQAELQVRLLPELIAGVRLRMGAYVWDASLAGQLPEARVPQEGNPST